MIPLIRQLKKMLIFSLARSNQKSINLICSLVSRKFLKNISATFTQLAINQIFGLLVFYLLSRYLNKYEFGEINWSLAVYLTSFGILSFGLEQIIVRKIASSEDPAELLSIHFLHVTIIGISFYGFELGLS